jgi:hypothetical protein
MPPRPAAARRPAREDPCPTPRPSLPKPSAPIEEAEARRRAARPLALPPEKGGRQGPEAVRFGDWEKEGRAIDF